MGRKKITIQKIEQKKDRLITFCKRRLGLLKKAAEISILCDVHVFLAFTDLSGSVFQFDSFRDSETTDRRRDMETTLEKIKTGNFVTYNLGQYPFDELKQQQPIHGDSEREEGFKASSDFGYPRAVGGQEGTSEAAQIRYHNPTSISQIKSSLDRVLITSSDHHCTTKFKDEFRQQSNGADQRDFSDELSPSDSATPKLQLFGDAVFPEPMRQDKYLKKVALMNASLENCRTEQALWSFIQSKGEEHEPLQIDGERLKRIRGRLRREFLLQCSRFKISQTRNDQDINELVILFYFIDRYLDLTLNGSSFEQGSYASRILGICSGSVMQALAGNFSFEEALGQEAKGRTKVLAEYFLRRFLDPSFHQFSPPNYMLVNCLCHSIMGYLQSVNLFLSLNGSRSLGSTNFTVDQEQLDHIGHLLDLTLRLFLSKDASSKEHLQTSSHPDFLRHQPDRRPEPSQQPKRDTNCSSCTHHSHPPVPTESGRTSQPPKEPAQASSQSQEQVSGGARIFSGAAAVFGSQKAPPRPQDQQTKIEPDK
jgi:hypothetical protein